MRLFFALLFNDKIKDELCSVMKKMESCCEKGRFTFRENLHLTLVFLGEISPVLLPRVQEAMDAVTEKPFSLQIGGLGCFQQRGGGLYWAGVEHTAPLDRVYRTLADRMHEAGILQEVRAYRPHLTLVRQAILKADCDRRAFTVPAMKMEVDSIHLMRSDRMAGHPVYTTVAVKKLGGGIIQ